MDNRVFINIQDMTNNDYEAWASSVETSGKNPEAHPAYSLSLSAAGRDVQLWRTRDAWCPFLVTGKTLTAICPSKPIIGLIDSGSRAEFRSILEYALNERMNLYFPLIDPDYFPILDPDCLKPEDQKYLLTWSRRPNAVIQWRGRSESMYDRALIRSNSQVSKKKRRIESLGYSLSTKEFGLSAKERMLEVDNSSWKYLRKQAMSQRDNQSQFYGSLLTSGFATASFLNYQDKPVAFRLDVLMEDALTCLKWSYSESHRRVSPGLYMLTTALDREWENSDLETIDLHGGPDALKRLIQTTEQPRCDVWCGNASTGKLLRADRLTFDGRTSENLRSGKGLRYAY